MKNNKLTISTILILLFLAGLGYLAYRSNINHVIDIHVPENATWINASESNYFKITPKIIINPSKPSDTLKAPHIVYDILIENKTNVPLYKVQATAFLPKEITEFISTPLAIFGNTDDTTVDLIPGKIPYALAISRGSRVPNYTSFPEDKKNGFLKAISLPIKLKITFEGGVEYLVINPESIIIEYNL